MKFFRAEYVSGKFEFDAYGPSQAAAIAALHVALRIHGRQSQIAPDWYSANHITVREIEMGASYRDRELLGVTK